DAAHAANHLARDGVDRRIVGAKHEGARDADAIEGAAHHGAVERLEVNGDVRQLRHRAILRGVAHPVGLPRASMPSMESIVPYALVAVVFAVVGFGVALFFARRDPVLDERAAGLEAQLASAREESMRLRMQAAELEREVETLRDQLLDTAQR